MLRANRNLFLAGMLVGAIVAPITLFSAGWIVTSGAAGARADEEATTAMLRSLTPICVWQFTQSGDHGQQLAKLKSLSEWSRPDFVADNGWATMPGGNSANSLVARECAQRLAAIEE